MVYVKTFLVKFKFIGQFEKLHELGCCDHEPPLLAGLYTVEPDRTELLLYFVNYSPPDGGALCFYSLFPRRPAPATHM